MKPITQLYRIVEGALKDDISMVMRYAKRLMRNNSMDIDWDETEKGIHEILNAYNNRPANIATLDNDNSITITSTILKSDTPDSNGCVYSKEALVKAVKEYDEKNGTYKMYPPEVFYTNDAFDKAVEKEMLRILKEQYKVSLSTGLKDKWKSLKDNKEYKDFNDMVSKIHENRVSIDEEIKEQAHLLANCFSVRYGYTSTEELLLEMGEYVKNRMLYKYNLENEDI